MSRGVWGAAFAGTTRGGAESGWRTDSRPIPRHRVDKTIPRVRMALPARFQHVAEQEHAGQAKTVLQVLVRPAVLAALALAQKGRQPQQPVAVRFARPPRHRAAGLWRDVDQVRGLAGGGAVFQIQAEAKF